MGKILSAAIVLLVFVGMYVAVSYIYKKKNEGGGCCGDCSHCGIESGCSSDKKDIKKDL